MVTSDSTAIQTGRCVLYWTELQENGFGTIQGRPMPIFVYNFLANFRNVHLFMKRNRVSDLRAVFTFFYINK